MDISNLNKCKNYNQVLVKIDVQYKYSNNNQEIHVKYQLNFKRVMLRTKIAKLINSFVTHLIFLTMVIIHKFLLLLMYTNIYLTKIKHTR